MNRIDCVSLAGLNSKLTPPDLYQGLVRCAEKGDYAAASELFFVAGVYATFDKLRVSDQTARQAHQVLTMQALSGLSEEVRKKMREAIKSRMGEGNAVGPDLCHAVRKIGKPDYYPRYMIQHGIKAFSGPQSNGGLVQDFDPEAAWNKALDIYLHCPVK